MANIKKLPRSFFAQDTVIVAQQLIGKQLVYHGEQGRLSGVITETEAYTQEDPACHAYKGRKSQRNNAMFKAPGHIYVYFIYGCHYCMNVVTETKGRGCAVLIRGIQPTDGQSVIQKNRGAHISETQLCNGPAKLVQALRVTPQMNGMDMISTRSPIWIEDHGRELACESTPRIGIRQGTELLWRFIAKDI